MDEITGWTEVDPVLGFGVGYGRTLNGGWYMSEYRGGDVVDVFEKDEEDGRWMHVSTVYLDNVGIVDRDSLITVAVRALRMWLEEMA